MQKCPLLLLAQTASVSKGQEIFVQDRGSVIPPRQDFEIILLNSCADFKANRTMLAFCSVVKVLSRSDSHFSREGSEKLSGGNIKRK